MELVIVRNPDPDSSLPYLLRVPIGNGLVFRTKGTWPRTSPGRTRFCARYLPRRVGYRAENA